MCEGTINTPTKMAKLQKAAKAAQDENATEPTLSNVANVVTEPTSEKLESLKSDLHTAKLAAKNAEIDSDEEKSAYEAIYKLQNEIKTEIANIAKLKIQAELDEKRNARMKFADDLINAVASACGVTDITPEIRAQFATQEESLKNELLSKIAVASAKRVSTGKTGGTRGGITAAIRALIAPLYAEGKTGSEVRSIVIKDNGFNDGTANAVIRAYELENGLAS